MGKTADRNRRSTAQHSPGRSTVLDIPAGREPMLQSVERTGTLSEFIGDMILTAQAAAGLRPPDRTRELQASLAAVTASAIAADVPPDAIGVLAMAGHHKRAADLAAMVAPESRGEAYSRIAIALKNKGQAETAHAAAAEAITAAETYARETGVHYWLERLAYSFRKGGASEWERQVLSALQELGAPGPDDDYHAVELLAGEGDIDGAWEAARGITNSMIRSLALGNIVVGALTQSGRFQDAISAASSVEDRSWALIADIAAIAAENGDVATTTEIVRSVPAEHNQWPVTKAGAVLARVGRAEDAVVLTQFIEDAGVRERAVWDVAATLAETGQTERAARVWTAAASSDHKDYYTAELAKKAAGADDVDGALHMAAAIDDDYYRRQAVAYAAGAALRGGDLRRATALVRVIGRESDEDNAFATVAKDLAASGSFDDADAAIGLIAATRVKTETLVAVASALAAAGDYQRSASRAEEAVQAAGGHVAALIIWARALTLSGEPSSAVAAAERAVATADQARNPEQTADALATWSAALLASGRQEEALAAAERAVAAVDAQDEHWGGDRRWWRDHRAENVAVILAEAGPVEQVVMLASSLAEDYDRDRVLSVVAEKLAQRGLADEAINAMRASPHVSSLSFRARDDVGKIARLLARCGHGDGALRAAYALADAAAPSAHVEYEVARLVDDLARILAENGHVETALATAGKSLPTWNRHAVYTKIAGAVALADDPERAAEIAETHGGHTALAEVAAALADSGRTEQALPIAEHAIHLVLTGSPRMLSTAYAIAMLESLAQSTSDGGPAGVQEESSASGPISSAAVAAAQRTAREAEAITDPAEKITAQASAAVGLALTGDPALMAQATAMARTVAEHARQIDELGQTATALGNAAMVFHLAEDPEMAAKSASQCLTMAAASPFRTASDTAATAAIDVLAGIGHITDAVAGLGSLKDEMNKARALHGIAKRLALSGRTAELSRLVSDRSGLSSIIGTYERIYALTGLGRVLAETGATTLAHQAGSLAEEASSLAGELAQPYEKAVALAGQAGLLAALGRRQEAIDIAQRALDAANKPIGGWRGDVITDAVDVLVRCGRIQDAAEAAKRVPPGERAACIVTVAGSLFGADEKERATALVSEEVAAVRTAGLRSAFYDLICTQLPKHPHLFSAWLGGMEISQISQELATIERWWN
jgi:tetratricopeptide (TPR) repeat protein